MNATLILVRDDKVDVRLLYLPLAPSKGDTVCIEGTLYKISEIRWDYSTNPNELHSVEITLNQIDKK